MSYTQDVNEVDVYTVLKAFIVSVTGLPTNAVLRIPTNRAPMPKTYPFITMSPVLKEQIMWPVVAVADPATQPQGRTITSATRYQIQVDAYGPTGGDLIQMLFTVLQSSDAFDFFSAQTTSGVYPLYATAPHQSPLVDEEAEYEVRWIMDVSLQCNPTLTTTVQTASTVAVTLINVEATYT
jgi:hypothetical protein